MTDDPSRTSALEAASPEPIAAYHRTPVVWLETATVDGGSGGLQPAELRRRERDGQATALAEDCPLLRRRTLRWRRSGTRYGAGMDLAAVHGQPESAR